MDLFVGTESEVLNKAEQAYTSIPDYTIQALHRYIYKRVQTGDFLYAVLSNDLFRAAGKADENNKKAFWDILIFIYNEIPSPAWGSKEKVEKWLTTSK